MTTKQEDLEWAKLIYDAERKAFARGCCRNEASPKQLWKALDNISKAIKDKLKYDEMTDEEHEAVISFLFNRKV